MSDRPFTYDPLYSNPELMRYAMKFAGIIRPEDRDRQLAANEEASSKAERTDRPPVVPIEVRPLHVRVAEALGMVACDKWEVWGVGIGGTEWMHKSPCNPPCFNAKEPPPYDTSWALTGPLIEKYRISFIIAFHETAWRAVFDAGYGHDGEIYSGADDAWESNGTTPLIAVCNLILALKQAGKLTI